MTEPAAESMAAASRFYSRLLRLYPKAHREAFGEQMLHTFEDSYRSAARATGLPSTEFWLAALWDECLSIVREHAAAVRRRLDRVLIGLLVVWAFATLLVPSTLPADKWPELLVVAAVLGTLFLAAPGFAHVAGKVATVAVLSALIAFAIAIGRAVNDVPDLVAPALLLVCMVLIVKTLAGWHAAVVGAMVAVWTLAELAYGLLIGVVGIVGLILSASTLADFDPLANFIFYGVFPLLCAVSGFTFGRRNQSETPGLYAALSAMLAGAGIWALARSAVADIVVHTSLLGEPGPAPFVLVGWHHGIGVALFIGAIFCTAGAALGQFDRDESRAAAHTQSF